MDMWCWPPFSSSISLLLSLSRLLTLRDRWQISFRFTTEIKAERKKMLNRGNWADVEGNLLMKNQYTQDRKQRTFYCIKYLLRLKGIGWVNSLGYDKLRYN